MGKTAGLVLVLSLSVLSLIPTVQILQVRAVSEGGGIPSFLPPFSAFGPRQRQIIFKVYDGTMSMLADFDGGNLDVTDAPDVVSRLNCVSNPNCDQANPNYYVTNPRAVLGEEQLDISHQVTFLGKPMQCLRSATDPSCAPAFAPGTPSITINSDTPLACDGTHFQLVVHLRNIEEGGAPVRDRSEVITVTPIAGTASSLSSTNSTYNFGCITALPPTYVVSTAVYGDASGNNAKVTLFTSAGSGLPQCSSNRICDVDFKVDYRSPSTKKPTVASIEIGRALSHLVDRPSLVNLPDLGGRAACDDILGSPAWGLMTSIGDAASACSNTNGGVPATEVSEQTIASECTDVSSSTGKPAGFTTIACGPTLPSLYNLAVDNIHAGDVSTGNACGAINSQGFQIPSGNCFPSQGKLASPSTLPEVGYSGPSDLTAACDYLLLAGFTVVPAGATCADVAAGNTVNGLTAHLDNNGQQISLIIRLANSFTPSRPKWGIIMGDELNFLFGTLFTTPGPSSTVCYGFLTPTPGPGAACGSTKPGFYNLPQILGVFGAQSTWNLYTGAQSHGSTPNTLLFDYHSQFASNTCGGLFATFPADYDDYCDPVYDTQVSAAEFSPSFASSFAFFQNAATVAATRGMLVPMITLTNQFLALDSWDTFNLRSSLVPSFGHGFAPGSPGSYWSLLNMRPNGQVTSGSFQAGGGVPGLIRRSSTGGVLHQNPFTSDLSPSPELDLLQMMFDSLLITNPNTGGSTLQIIDWMTKSHSTSLDTTIGRSTQIFNLRNDICWHDSVTGSLGLMCDRPVTADDVCFTFSFRETGREWLPPLSVT